MNGLIGCFLLACAAAPDAPEPVAAVSIGPEAAETPVPTVASVAAAPVEPEPLPEPPPPPPKPRPPKGALPDASRLPSGEEDYRSLVSAIETARNTFAQYDAHPEARRYLLAAITEHIIPAWLGTPWEFYGTAEVPHEGAVACGYWVASVLRDAGFRVNRNHLGKQASEKILLTLAEPSRLRHFGSRPVEDVIAAVERAGEGLWGVGLANHAGFLWNDGKVVRFCHSNYMGFRGPMCEDAAFSAPFSTSYTVIAPLLADATLDAWLEGRPLATGNFADAPG